MLDHDSVEGFKAMDWAKGFSFFLDYAEPAQAVQGVGALIYTGIHLHANDFADFVIDARRYQNVPFDPGHVHDDRDFDRWKEILVEMNMLGVIPSKSFIFECHEMM